MSFYNLDFKQQSIKHNMGPLHTHDFYELEFLVSGRRNYFTKTKLFKMTAPTLVVIKPRTTHKFESGGCEVYTLQISPESLSQDQIYFLDRLAKEEEIKLLSHKAAAIETVYKQMLQIYQSFPFNANKKMQFALQLGVLFQLFWKYAYISKSDDSELEQEISPTITPTILKVVDFVKSHYKENFTLDELCKQFGISKSYLSLCFMRATNNTVFQYKLALQLEEAKRLCRETRHSYDKIAEMTGFSSGNYFRLIFKKHVGQTPKQHRYNSFEKRKRPSK